MIIALRKRMKSQKGFTLIELMIVIAIIGILAAIAIPRFSNATNSANVAKAQADLSTLDSAITVYLAANPSGVPTAGSTGNLVTDGYLASWPAPPTSDVNTKAGNVTKNTAYTISGGSTTTNGTTTTAPYRATWDGHHAEDL